MDFNKSSSDKSNIKEVKTERQEKKQSAKLKNKNKKDKQHDDVVVKNNEEKLNKSIDKEKILTETLKVVKSLDDSSHKETEKDVADKTLTITTPKQTMIENNKIPTTEIIKEKTREEIKAEREARKQAKLNAKKLKVKNNQQSVKSNELIEMNKKPVVVDVDELDTSKQLNEMKTVKKVDGTNENVNKEQSKEIVAAAVVAPPEKSKAELRAERRAKQEAQRAAKESEKLSKLSQKENIPVQRNENKIENIEKSQKQRLMATADKVGCQRVKLFNHLKFEAKTCDSKLMPNIHPEIVKLGIKYSSRIVMGSNARCVALLKALKEVIMDYITPSEKEFTRGLESHLTNLLGYLNKCRPSSVSMTNALRHIKSHLTQLPNNINETEARRKLCDVIDTFIREQIDVAGEAICNAVQNKIANGDNILIYACSSLLYRILVESHKSGKQFTVVVVDSGPWFEGREMTRRLVDHGIKCSYVLVSALSFIMREVTKVLLGAHALLANGSVMSRAGSALVALVANSFNVPVLVCCETYKFCERVQMDAFVYNELGNDEDMEYSKAKYIIKSSGETNVAPLSVLYDITPADLVTAVVTELAILPCTSVPVILRIRPSDVVS